MFYGYDYYGYIHESVPFCSDQLNLSLSHLEKLYYVFEACVTSLIKNKHHIFSQGVDPTSVGSTPCEIYRPVATLPTFHFSTTFYYLSFSNKEESNLFLLHHSLIKPIKRYTSIIIIIFSFPSPHGPRPFHQIFLFI